MFINAFEMISRNGSLFDTWLKSACRTTVAVQSIGFQCTSFAWSLACYIFQYNGCGDRSRYLQLISVHYSSVRAQHAQQSRECLASALLPGQILWSADRAAAARGRTKLASSNCCNFPVQMCA